MQKLIAPWREIVRDFSWTPLALLFVYSAVAMAMQMQRPNPEWLGETIMSLIRLMGWLTIIAILVPRNEISIPVRRPLPELVYLCIWGIAYAVVLIYFWSLVSSRDRSATNIHIVSVLGQFVLAILFTRLFRYSASALGITLKHWQLYLVIVLVTPIIIMALSATMRAFPSIPFPLWILRAEYFNIGVGLFWVLVLFALYFSNRKRWQGLADDWKSLRPFILPILLCSLISVGLVWSFRDNSQIQWSLPLRAFDPITMIQGAMPEEFYHRLGLQTRLTYFLPFGWASLLDGIAFAANHFPRSLALGYLQAGDLVWSLTPGIVNAMAGGYFWYRSKNLPATILFHMAVFI